MNSAPATQQDIAFVRQDLKDHVKEDHEFQEKILDKLDKRFDSIDNKLEELWDEKNFRDGIEKNIESEEEKRERIFSRRDRVITIFLGFITAFITVKFSK